MLRDLGVKPSKRIPDQWTRLSQVAGINLSASHTAQSSQSQHLREAREAKHVMPSVRRPEADMR